MSHHLSRREPDDTEFGDAIKEFTEGTDRVAAIMGSALVENSLMSAIRTALVDAFNDNVLFHDQGAPFGTFKARIVAGRALGLFDEEIAKDLDVIRDIRNQFAHALLSLDFKNPHIVARCSELRDHKVEVDGRPVVPIPGRAEKVPPARFRYERSCYALSILLLQSENGLLDKRVEQARAELEGVRSETERLENVGERNALADFVAAGIEGGTEDVENDIAPDKG